MTADSINDNTTLGHENAGVFGVEAVTVVGAAVPDGITEKLEAATRAASLITSQARSFLFDLSNGLFRIGYPWHVVACDPFSTDPSSRNP